MFRFKGRVIKPRPLDANALKAWAEEAANDYFNNVARPAFNLTVATWSDQSKPKFVITVKREGGKVLGTLYAEDDRIYRFVSEGTSVRYATMTPNFVPKTQPGRIAALRGQGGLAFVSTQRPNPGIEARKFDAEIAKQTKSLFMSAAQRAMTRAVERSGHRYG